MTAADSTQECSVCFSTPAAESPRLEVPCSPSIPQAGHAETSSSVHPHQACQWYCLCAGKCTLFGGFGPYSHYGSQDELDTGSDGDCCDPASIQSEHGQPMVVASPDLDVHCAKGNRPRKLLSSYTKRRISKMRAEDEIATLCRRKHPAVAVDQSQMNHSSRKFKSRLGYIESPLIRNNIGRGELRQKERGG